MNPRTELDELYQEILLDHYRRPRNFGPLAGADREVDGHNPLCGDRVRLRLKLEGDRLADVRFEGVQPLASASVAETLRARDLDGRPLSSEELPMRYAMENRRPTHRKFRIARADGVERCVEGTAFPLVSQGGDHVGTVSIFWETAE